MICRDCGWTGGIEELEPQGGDEFGEFGNELCPACGGMDVIPREEVIERESVDMRMDERNEDLPARLQGRGQAQTGEHQELRIGLSWYIAGCFPALPYAVAKHIANDAVEAMLEDANACLRRQEASEEAQDEPA